MKLVVGLGNPGEKYAATRHNIGFMVATTLADSAGISLRKQGHQGIYGVGRIEGEEVTVLLPQTFMNLSGASVRSAIKSLGVTPGDLIVIHDDIDLDFGLLRLRRGGGHGGHNGIRHIREVLGSGDFLRVKVGVGRPPEGGDVARHVLGRFSSTEKARLPQLTDEAGAAIRAVLSMGEVAAMNDFNGRKAIG